MGDEKFLYGDLTGALIHIANKIFNDIGYGYREKIYQKAFEKELSKNCIQYRREAYSKILYDGEVLGRFYLDFLIENKIAVELKVRREVYESDWVQLLNYLKSEDLKVGLLIVISKHGVVVKRLVN
jgi:GxxExxY protein